MIVHWIRHAESRANAGESEGPDSGLTHLGREQASRLARRLSEPRPAAIFSSPFGRALETAAPVAEQTGRPVYVRGEVAEYLAPGLFPGRSFRKPPWEVLARRFPAAELDPEAGGILWPSWPESLEELIERQQRFVAELKARWGGSRETVVVFSHGAPTARAVEAWLTGRPGPEFTFVISNAAVATLRYEEGVSSLLSLNERSHLAGLPAPPWNDYFENHSSRSRP